MSSEQPKEQLPKEDLNFHQIARERAELRRIDRVTGAETANIIEEELEALDQKAQEFSRIRKEDPKVAKELLKTQKHKYERSEWLDEATIQAELGEVYDILTESKDKLSEVDDFEMRQLRDSVYNADIRKINERVLGKISDKKNKLRADIKKITEAHPLESRAFSLIQYKKGLYQEGHIASVPSVREYRHQIGTRMISGKPMFIHGPTGTGKTSIARNSAEHFTGQKPEMVYCNPQTREANIWGKTGLRPAGGEAGKHGAIETVDIFGPLARAAQEGKVVIFDEFTALPKEQQVMIKGIFNAKPGDTVNIMGNGIITIKSGFQMIFTANLKSEKNPERQDLPPEIAREFEQNNLEVQYTSPEESYDIMLARLMNSDGSIDLSYHDLNQTLPQFTKAMAEIQQAYTDKESEETARLTQTLDASNKRPGLKKLVLTQGTVENIIDAWKIEKQTNPSTHSTSSGRASSRLLGEARSEGAAGQATSFTEFLDQRLKIALTFKEYPLADRILTAKILASKGFLRTTTPGDLDLPQDVFNFDAANRLRTDPKAIQELTDKSAEESHLSLTEVSQLDPFNRKQIKMAEAAKEFLPEEDKEEETIQPNQRQEILFNKNFIKETFKIWSVNDQKIQESEQNMTAEMISPRAIDWNQRKQDIDASKSGEYTLNPETQSTNWDMIPTNKIKIEKLPKNMEGRNLAEVAEYIINTYSNKYYIPGLEFYKYVIENPGKVPLELKDSNHHFFFGSILRGSHGRWDVPVVYWLGSRFGRSAYWLGHGWDSDFRVVLLEK